MVHREEEPDLMLAHQFFAARDLLARRIRQKTGKTPDFGIFRTRTLVAYCEVKSPQDVFQERLDKAIRQAPEGNLGKIWTGNVSRQYLRIKSAAKKAVAQFNAVNPSHEHPNILMFVNHDTTSRQSDFEEAVMGHFGGRRVGESLRDEIAEIDAYVWLNADGSQGRSLWQQNRFRDAIVDILRT